MLPLREQERLSEIMERHEQAISRLYKSYARHFPQYKSLWQRLANAEIEHAEQIRVFRARLKEGNIDFSEAHQKTEDTIQSSLEKIEKEIDRAEKGHMTLTDAVSVARDLERSMIENDWFKSYKTDSELFARVLHALGQETQKHLSELSSLLESIGGVPANKGDGGETAPGIMQRLPED